MANKDEIRYTISVDTESGTASVRNLKGQIVATQVPVKQLRAEFGNFAKTVNATNFNKFNSELKKTNSSISNLNKGLSGASAASGSASASVLEVGRAISDSNYGIQGMANNLSQLASNLVYTTKTAGGLSKGLKALGKAFLGPLGVIVVIQTVIMLFERMAMESSKTKDALEDLNDTGITESVTKLMLLKDALNDSNISLRDKNSLIKEAKEEYKDLNIAIDENGMATASSVVAIDAEIDALMRSAKAKAINKVASELMTEQIKKETSDLNDNISWYEIALSRLTNFSVADAVSSGVEKAEENREEAVSGFQEQIDKLKMMLKEDADPDDPNSGILLQWLFGKKKDSGRARRRADRVFKEQVLDLQKFILQQQRDTEKSKERNVMNLLEIDQRYAREDLKLTLETFNIKQQLRFNQWAEQEARRQKMSIEEFRQTEKYGEELLKLQKSLADADAEYKVAVDNQKLAQEAETQRKRLEITEKFNDLILKANLKSAKAEAQARLGRYDGTNAGSLGKPQSKVGAEGVDEQIAIKEALIAEEQANFEKTLARKLENLRNEGFLLAEAEAIIAQDRFQFQTDMVTRELELEQMKVDAKRSINEEYVSWFSGLGSIFRNIAGENEALANLALVLEKGSAIAGIIIKTQSANRQLMNTATAESAELTAKGTASIATGTMLSVVDPIRGSAMITAGNAGLASAGAIMTGAEAVKTKNNIGAGLSIAQILSTTLQSRSSGGGGGGSSSAGASGGGGRTFDFNLVGSTGENQLAQGIAGQLGNPVQAYVVSSQMTSQQQLDNAIQTSATIGD